jgi:putative transcriptional regulator
VKNIQFCWTKKNTWGYVMTKKIRSEAFESIHSSAEALLKIGAIDKAAMREFDEVCMAEVSAEVSVQENSSALRTSPQNPR